MKQLNLLRLFTLLFLAFFFQNAGLESQNLCAKKLVAQPDSAAGKDAFVHSKTGYENLNFGSAASFDAMTWTFNGNPGTLREYFDFDLSAIPAGAVIVFAQLDLFGKTEANGGAHSCLSGPNDFVFRRVTSNWAENTVTWNAQPTVTNSNQLLAPALCTPAADASFSFTQLVQDYVNNPATSFGFQMALQNEAFYRALIFHASDSNDPTKRPRLQIEYLVPCPCLKTLVAQPDSADGKDAFVHEKTAYQNTNFGSAPSFDAMTWTFLGEKATLREYFDFDLSAIPAGATIVSAQLDLFGKTETNGAAHSCLSGPNDFVFRRVTSNWAENTATWNLQPTVTNANQLLVSSLCTPAADASFSFTQLVQDYVNNPATSFGFQMALQNEAFYRALIFHASESNDPTKRPKLTVVFEVPCGCEKNIVQNGTFSSGIVQGNLGGPGACNNWFTGFATPQAITHDSCAEIGAMQMWGNQIVGEGIFQPVNFVAGRTYEINFCGLYVPQVQNNVRIRMRATTGSPLAAGDYFNCGGYCDEIVLSPILTTAWTTYTATWTAPQNFDHLNITVWNDFSINDGAFVSWARIDDVCIIDRKGGQSTATEEAEKGPKTSEKGQTELAADVFPNPTFDQTTVRFDEPTTSKTRLRLLDMNGRTLQNQTLELGTEQFSIGLERFPAGIYLLVIEAENGLSLRKKVVKQ